MTAEHPLAGLVKPLEFAVRDDARAGLFADAPTGVYRVFNANGSGYWMWMLYAWWPRSGCVLDGEGETFDTAFKDEAAAIEAANRHHAVRILSAIPADAANAMIGAAKAEGMREAAKARGIWLQFNTEGDPIGYCTVEPHDPGGMTFYVRRDAILAAAEAREADHG